MCTYKATFPMQLPCLGLIILCLPARWGAEMKGEEDGRGYLCVKNNQGSWTNTWSNCVLLSIINGRQRTMTNKRSLAMQFAAHPLGKEKREKYDSSPFSVHSNTAILDDYSAM